MKVSVVVANHGRDLTTLRNSIPEECELVVIDEGRERSWQRNKGIRQATGNIIIWLDSDQSLSSGLIKEIQMLIGLGFVALYIPEIIVAKSFFGKVRAFERTFYDGTVVDVPRAVLKKHCPLFDETLNGPEDADWGRKIKGLRAITKGVLYHHDDIGVVEYFKKKNYYAKSMRRYKELNPHDKVLDWKYRCVGIFIEKGKWRKILRHPILFFCVMLVVAVRAYIYIKNK
jgi:glycosyltransferase involved in cell wall biosynthesis